MHVLARREKEEKREGATRGGVETETRRTVQGGKWWKSIRRDRTCARARVNFVNLTSRKYAKNAISLGYGRR